MTQDEPLLDWEEEPVEGLPPKPETRVCDDEGREDAGGDPTSSNPTADPIESWQEDPVEPPQNTRWIKRGSGLKSILLVAGVTVALIIATSFACLKVMDAVSGFDSEAPEREAIGWDKDLDAVADEGDVIVATHPDTSSKLGLDVDLAFIGTGSDGNKVVVFRGSFSNGTDEAESFASALDLEAKQGSTELDEAWLQNTFDYRWTKRDPGATAEVVFAFELANGQDDVTVTATDWDHYAHEVVFERTYTVAELLDAAKDAPAELIEQL